MIAPIILTVGVVVAGQLLLKTGMAQLGAVGLADLRHPLSFTLRLLRNARVVTGLVAYLASALMWIWVLARVEVSFAYPFLSLSYVAVTLAAVIVLRERVSPAQWAGVALVVAGVFVVASTAT